MDYLLRSKRRNLTHYWAFGFVALISIIVTWPLVLHLTGKVPGWYIADNYEYLWKMWWFKRAIVDLHTNPLFVPTILYPHGFSLAYAEITPLHTLIGLPFTWLFGEIFSYNMFALASFIISGWAVYLLLIKWTDNPWAGVFASVLFILNPYHVVRYGGILPLMSLEGLPIFILGIEYWVSSRRFAWILLAFLGYFMASWASIYYAFGLFLLGSLYVLFRLFYLRKTVINTKTIIHLASLFILVILATIPLILPYLSLQSSSKLSIPLQDTDYWSASFTDYLVPTALHPFWGQWATKNALGVPVEYPQIAFEFMLAGGYIGLLFAVYGIFKNHNLEKKSLVILTLTALILSFGTTFHIARHPLIIPVPPSIATIFNQIMEDIGRWLPAHESFNPLAAEGIKIPMPALFLRWIFPFLTGMRAWNRFAAFSSLGLSLLAGLGFSTWMKQEVLGKLSTRKALILIFSFILVALFELWPIQIPLQKVAPRQVDLWLAKQPGDGSIMELPLTSALSAPQMLYSRYHGKPISFAYGTFLPYWYRQNYPELEDCPQYACLARLRSWKVEYLLLNLSDPGGGPNLIEKLNFSPDLERITQVGDHIIYRLLY